MQIRIGEWIIRSECIVSMRRNCDRLTLNMDNQDRIELEGAEANAMHAFLLADAIEIDHAIKAVTRPSQIQDTWRSEAIIRRIRTLADQYGEKVRPGSNDVQSRVLTSVVRDLRAIADEASGTEDRGVAP